MKVIYDIGCLWEDLRRGLTQGEQPLGSDHSFHPKPFTIISINGKALEINANKCYEDKIGGRYQKNELR